VLFEAVSTQGANPCISITINSGLIFLPELGEGHFLPTPKSVNMDDSVSIHTTHIEAEYAPLLPKEEPNPFYLIVPQGIHLSCSTG
jgi:hypothetical protein